MNEEHRRILKLLSEGKVNAEEAEALLEAIDIPEASAAPVTRADRTKYLRVVVQGRAGESIEKVNVRVPLELLRAGVRLAALLPSVAYEPINRALKSSGVDVDVSTLKTKDLEDIVRHLGEVAIDVTGEQGEQVRVFCE
jgi:hypothetical protein